MALIPGNLFDENTQDFDNDTSGWESDNASLDRVSATVIPPGPQPVMRVTADTEGDVSFRTAARYAVEAGALYLAYGHIATPDPTTVTAQIRWYSVDDTEIGDPAEHVEPVPLENGAGVRRCNVMGAAPEGAEYARVEFHMPPGAPVTYWDVMFLGSAPEIGGLLSYEACGVEFSDSYYTSQTAELERRRIAHTAGEGFYDLRVVPEGPGQHDISVTELFPVEPGERYQARVWGWLDSGNDPNAVMHFRARVDWYDDGGSLIQRGDSGTYATFGGEGGWEGLGITRSGTCPAGATQGQMVVDLLQESTTAVEYHLDEFEAHHIPLGYEYRVDNDRGMVSLAVSRTPPDEPPEGVFSLLRVDESGSETPVRGYGSDLLRAEIEDFTGTVYAEDYEAPLGQRIWYRAIWEGTYGRAEIQTPVFEGPTLPDGNLAWLKSPGQPALNTVIMMAEPISWSRASRSAQYDIVGRTNPVVISARRAGKVGNLSAYSWDERQYEELDALLDSGLPVLLQAMPGHGQPGNRYLDVGDTTAEVLAGARDHLWRWSADVTVIDRPAGGIEGSAARTWADVLDEYMQWDDVRAETDWRTILVGGQ